MKGERSIMKTIGIIGTRRRTSLEDYDKVLTAFKEMYEDGDEIVSGGCPRGGDQFAEEIAESYQVPIKIYYAQWDKHGKAAGFIRNQDIARDADVMIACVSEDRTGGTEDTLKKFNGKVVLV
jgi:hypothetical protein